MIEYYDITNINRTHSRPEFRKRLNLILKMFEKKEYLTMKELRDKIKISRTYLQEHLSYLIYDKKILKHNKGKNSVWSLRK